MTMDSEGNNNSSRSIQLLQDAIQQLTQSKNPKPFQPIQIDDQISSTAKTADDDDEIQILTNLISQLESVKQEGMMKQSESSSSEDANTEGKETKKNSCRAEEISKELRDVKRQNKVTHWLVSGMIALTLVWQLSEVSIILKVKKGLNHPFSTIWSWIRGSVRGPSNTNGSDPDHRQPSIKDTLVETAAQMDLELPHLQLPSLVSMDDK